MNRRKLRYLIALVESWKNPYRTSWQVQFTYGPVITYCLEIDGRVHVQGEK